MSVDKNPCIQAKGEPWLRLLLLLLPLLPRLLPLLLLSWSWHHFKSLQKLQAICSLH